MAKVSVRNVYKIYPGEKGQDVTAVKDVNLEVADREFVVLVGPSGCGKSTTLADDRRTRGNLEGRHLHRRQAGERRPAERSRHRDGLPKLRALSAHERLRQSGVRLEAAEISEGGNQEARVGCGAACSASKRLLERKPKALSGGQRQRVAVGRAIVRQPKVFLFDEPLSNLDAKMRVQMRTEITKLHQRLQATMIYVTHDQIEAMTMGDRIVRDERRRRAAERHAAEALQRAGESFRRRLSRQSADEFHHRHAEGGTASSSVSREIEGGTIDLAFPAAERAGGEGIHRQTDHPRDSAGRSGSRASSTAKKAGPPPAAVSRRSSTSSSRWARRRISTCKPARTRSSAAASESFDHREAGHRFQFEMQPCKRPIFSIPSRRGAFDSNPAVRKRMQDILAKE